MYCLIFPWYRNSRLSADRIGFSAGFFLSLQMVFSSNVLRWPFLYVCISLISPLLVRALVIMDQNPPLSPHLIYSHIWGQGFNIQILGAQFSLEEVFSHLHSPCCCLLQNPDHSFHFTTFFLFFYFSYFKAYIQLSIIYFTRQMHLTLIFLTIESPAPQTVPSTHYLEQESNLTIDSQGRDYVCLLISQSPTPSTVRTGKNVSHVT